MAVEIYEDDDTTLVEDLAVTNYEAGSDSDVLTLHVWNDKGGAGPTVQNLLLALRTEDPTSADVYLAQGVPPQDELWGRFRVVGYDNTGDSSWSTPNTDWIPVGAYSGLLIASLPGDCAVYMEVKLRPPSGADVNTWRHAIARIYDQYAIPLPRGLGNTRRGVLPGTGDGAQSGIWKGGEVTESGGGADEYANTAATYWIHNGIPYGKVSETHELDQDDGSAATLASGESYWAVLTLGAGSVTVTKGDKASSPTKPTPPAGDLRLAEVLVEYQAGGTSVIETADITDVRILDRYHFEPDASGLSGTLHGGKAITGSTWTYRANTTALAFTASVENYVWLLPTGLPSVTTSSTPPEDHALLLWWVDCDGSDVIDWEDRRSYAGDVRIIELAGDVPGSPGEFDWTAIPEDRLYIESVHWQQDSSGGGSGSTIGEIKIDGTTIYTSSGSDDQRPTVAFNATDPYHTDGIPEVLELRRWNVLSAETAQHSGTAPNSIRCLVVCRVG